MGTGFSTDDYSDIGFIVGTKINAMLLMLLG